MISSCFPPLPELAAQLVWLPLERRFALQHRFVEPVPQTHPEHHPLAPGVALERLAVVLDVQVVGALGLVVRATENFANRLRFFARRAPWLHAAVPKK